MPRVQHGPINELAAQRAQDIVGVAVLRSENDPESVANGARVTSEVFLRTLGSMGIELPESFPETLAAEFTSAYRHDSLAVVIQHARVQEMEATGP